MINLTPLFATNLFSTFIKENTNELLKEKSYVNSVKNTKKNGTQGGTVGTVNKHGKISKNNLRVLEKYPKVKKILLDKWLEISKNILHLPNDFIISTSWVTKVVQGDESQTHCHKNSYYSGVYYFDKYFKDSAKIELINPNDKNIDFYLPPSKYNLHNSSSWAVTPEKNKLLFFPSYLTHNILNNKNNNSRKSLAFNIIPVGEYGMGDSLIDTKWFKK